MNRRSFVAGLAAAGACSALPPQALLAQEAGASPFAVLHAAWRLWTSRHLDPSGRVVDDLQSRASHSEGQGYGLTLAALMGDENAALSIVGWTEDNLAMRDDGLLAWRWFPDRADPIADPNNASDGDLFYAWGCLLAGRAFGRADLVERAKAITAALAAKCIVPDPRSNGRLLFVPAVNGFRREDSVVINPSYVMPLAMQELGAAAGEPLFADAARDAVAMLGDLAVDGTTPDWILITPDGPEIDEVLSDRTGYEAIRVPLFLIWSGLRPNAMVERHRAVAVAAEPRPGIAPTVFERTTGTVLERSNDVGYQALSALLGCGERGGSNPFLPIPPFGAPQPYYPATLHMMSLVAQLDRYPGCVPL